MGRQGPSTLVPPCPRPDPLNHPGVGVPYLVLLSSLLVRLNWPLVATPRPDLTAAAAPSHSSGSRGHGGASAASRSRAGKGAGEAEAASLEPPTRPAPAQKSVRAAHTVGHKHTRNREVTSRVKRKCALAAGEGRSGDRGPVAGSAPADSRGPPPLCMSRSLWRYPAENHQSGSARRLGLTRLGS